jgi:hypothetical protein
MPIKAPRKKKEPGTKAPGKKAGSPKESLIAKSIETLLRYCQIFHWRMYTGPRLYKGKKFLPSLQVGMPDIIGVLPDGKFFAIEVKKPGGDITPAQLDTIQAINARGGIAFIATRVEDVKQNLGAYLGKISA